MTANYTAIPMPRMYRGIPNMVRKGGITMKELMNAFNPKEAKEMAYVPIIMTKAAFRYAERVCQYCAEHRLPYKEQTRTIKDAITEYNKTMFRGMQSETYERLKEQIDEFCDASSRDIQTLWFVVNGNLKKYYPELENYDLLTLIYCTLCIMVYVRKFEQYSDESIRERLHVYNYTTKNEQLERVTMALASIAGKYMLHREEAVNLSMHIISLKLEQILHRDEKSDNILDNE